MKKYDQPECYDNFEASSSGEAVWCLKVMLNFFVELITLHLATLMHKFVVFYKNLKHKDMLITLS